MHSPVIIGLCGPNGSGKSTVYEALVDQKKLPKLPWINADVILRQFQKQPLIPLSSFGISNVTARTFNLAVETHSLRATIAENGHSLSLLAFGDPVQLATDNQATAYEAALAAAVTRDLLIGSNKSFAFETVMSHPSKVDLFKLAKQAGYQTQMIFVCTEDVELNINRVAQRVREGGHDVSETKIRSRYQKAIALLPVAAAICDTVMLIDTTHNIRKLVSSKADNTWHVYGPIPTWAKATLSHLS